MLNRLLLAVVLLTALGCRAKKMAPAPIPVPAETEASRNKAEVLKSINSAKPNYTTVAIKAKAGITFNNNSNDVSMTIRIKKDKVIWVSVTAIAGIEVARALITPDSIKLLNRIQGEYLAKPFSYIHRYANKRVDFGAVEALLTGAAVPGTVSERSVIENDNGNVRLSGDLAGLAYILLFNEVNNLVQNDLNDEATAQRLSVSYNAYQKVGGQFMPSSVTIKSGTRTQNVNLDLKYNNITINESLDFSFTVPKRFSVIN